MLAAAGYLLAGASSGFSILAAALILGGVGSSTQHPIASRRKRKQERDRDRGDNADRSERQHS
jgi:hypothetical protein